jgi:hypothetical protein
VDGGAGDEVPILAPMMMGIAPSMVRAPAATRPTVIEVVVDELCTSVVARMPMKSPTKGLAVRSIRASAKPFPMSLKPRPMRSSPTKNPNNTSSRRAIRRISSALRFKRRSPRLGARQIQSSYSPYD